jgi:hypothetical protein
VDPLYWAISYWAYCGKHWVGGAEKREGIRETWKRESKGKGRGEGNKN